MAKLLKYKGQDQVKKGLTAESHSNKHCQTLGPLKGKKVETKLNQKVNNTVVAITLERIVIEKSMQLSNAMGRGYAISDCLVVYVCVWS